MRLHFDHRLAPAGELCDFGYGRPDCRVWRYWDDRLPLATTGVPVKTLILARQGKAMVVVASYGPGGEIILDFDRKSLGVPDNAIALDAETNAELPRLEAGRFKLTLARHDFRLILVEPPGPRACVERLPSRFGRAVGGEGGSSKIAENGYSSGNSP